MYDYIIFSILTLLMKITLAAPSVCPELYSHMHFPDLSLYITTFIELHTVCLSKIPLFLAVINDQSNHTAGMIITPKLTSAIDIVMSILTILVMVF